jgi:hypothetical protein
MLLPVIQTVQSGLLRSGWNQLWLNGGAALALVWEDREKSRENLGTV